MYKYRHSKLAAPLRKAPLWLFERMSLLVHDPAGYEKDDKIDAVKRLMIYSRDP